MAKEEQEIQQNEENESEEVQDEGTSESSEGSERKDEKESLLEGGDPKSEEEEETEEVDPEVLALAKLLSSPETREIAIKALTKDVQAQVDDGKSQKAAVRSVKDALKTSLGDDWAFLADKLAPVFDGLLNYTATLEQRLSEADQARVTRESESAARNFFKENPDAKRYEGQIVSLMEKYNPPKGSDPAEYLNDLWILVKAKSVGTTTAKKMQEKLNQRIQRNSGDVQTRSQGESAKQSDKPMSLEDSVRAAMQTLQSKR